MNEFEIICNVDGVVNPTTYPNIPGGGIFGITCPNCPFGNTHSVLSSRLLRTFQNETTVIREEEIPTQGYMLVMGYTYDIPSGNTGDITRLELPVVENINVYEVNLLSSDENYGDSFTMYSGPTAPLGVLTQNLSSGDTCAYISSQGISYYCKGFTLGVKNGTGPVVPVGIISDIDTNTNKLSFRNPTTYTITAGSYVYLWVTRGLDIPLMNYMQILGNGKIGGSYATKGYLVTIFYKNSTGLAKKFRIAIECTY